MAEREGFEPSVPVTQYARLAISRRSANTGTLARLLETENPCGSAICRIRAGREMSHRVSPDLIQSGKFTPPCPHPRFAGMGSITKSERGERAVIFLTNRKRVSS